MPDTPARFSDTPGLPDGTEVYVAKGRYVGEHGQVVSRRPDLRPGCVWVDLGRSGIHLLVSANLIPQGND